MPEHIGGGRPAMADSFDCWRPLVDQIGRCDFQDVLFSGLAREIGADFCLLSDLSERQPQALGVMGRRGAKHATERYNRYVSRSCWEFDPLIEVARSRLPSGEMIVAHQPRSMLETSTASMIYNTDIVDRLAAIGMCGNRSLMLTLFRGASSSQFSADEVQWLQRTGGTLLSLIAKHSEVLRSNDSLLDALTSIDIIEAHLAGNGSRLTRREREVCARLLTGLSATQIATDLAIGAESVATYRKRALEKIGVTKQRDLLPWYVADWLGSGSIVRQ